MEVYLGAFWLGVGATITPCILPLYPAFLAYLTGGLVTEGPGAEAVTGEIGPARAALLVWAGVVVGMVAIGAVLAAIAAPLGDFNAIILPIADVALIVLGVMLL